MTWQFTTSAGVPYKDTLLLTTKGAKTGKSRTNGLPYFEVDGEYLVIGHPNVVVPNGTPFIAFADAVEKLLDDAELRADRGVAARQRVSKALDWRPQAENYVAVFDDLTGHRGIAPTPALVAPPAAPAAEPPSQLAARGLYADPQARP